MKTKRYRKRKRANQFVVAVQINLETDGFRYRKWGGEQRCSSGDWLVDNDGDFYTVSQESFTKTYEKVAPGQYVKTASVWAYKVSSAGKVKTNEGFTEYVAGDYWVANTPDGADAYAVSKLKFEEMYEEVEQM